MTYEQMKKTVENMVNIVMFTAENGGSATDSEIMTALNLTPEAYMESVNLWIQLYPEEGAWTPDVSQNIL